MVLADGCFDPLHIGHVRYLEACAQFGELAVNIANDETIRAKGREPFQTSRERERTIAALRCVARIDSYDLIQLLKTGRYDALAKGWDWMGKLPEDIIETCRERCIAIIYIPTQERTSTERLNA